MASATQSVGHGERRSRQLEFTKAMSDFKSMFPSIDYDVIEMVLRGNNGLVDATVDQLLTMQEEAGETEHKLLDPDLNVRLPSYDDPSSLSTFEPPPAYTPRADEDHESFSYDSTFLGPRLDSFSSSRENNSSSYKTHTWNPPLLGSLPNDFLRININDSGARSTPWRDEVFSRSRNGENSVAESSWSSPRTPFPSGDHSTTRTPVARPVVNGFDAIPESESRPTKSSGNKSKNKRFGQMSRKFRRKTTKTSKSTYQPILSENLIDENSGEERDVQR